MPRWVSARGGMPGEHLPPPDACTNLICKNGKVTVRQTYDMPVDEFGLPDAEATLAIVNSTIDPDYEWPYLTNVHHLCYPRREYHADPLLHELREGSAMLRRMPVQQHNLLHRTFEYMPLPSRDIVRERVVEQRHYDNIFQLGRLAIRFDRWAHTLVEPEALVGKLAVRDSLALSVYYRRTADIYEDRYHAYIEKLPVQGGPTGLLPPRDDLADMHTAIPRIGQAVGQGFIDIRRQAQERKDVTLAA